MSALVITSENNLQYMDTGGSPVQISSDNEYVYAEADYNGNIWALVNEESMKGGDTGHAYVIYYCDSPGAGATFTKVGTGIHASALAPSAVQNGCYYLDANGLVMFTDTKGSTKQIYNLEGTGWSPLGIAYSSDGASDNGTLFLLTGPANDYNGNKPHSERMENVIQYWSELYPGSAPTIITGNHSPTRIGGGSNTNSGTVYVLDSSGAVFTLDTKGTAGTSSSNADGILSIGGTNNASKKHLYAVSAAAHYTGSANKPIFDGGNILLKYNSSTNTWENVTTTEGITRVQQAYK